MKKLIFMILAVNALNYTSFGQNKKLAHSYSDYHFSINIDEKIWQKITYEEINSSHKKLGINTDIFLENRNYEAVFMYKKIGFENDFNHTSPSISIEIYKTDSSEKYVYLKDIYDTIESNVLPFLENMETSKIDSGKYKFYYNSLNGSIILKYAVMIEETQLEHKLSKIKEHHSIKPFVIEQNMFIGGFRVLVIYIFPNQIEREYFSYFENIIRSLKPLVIQEAKKESL